jgi:RecA-family ATPase
MDDSTQKFMRAFGTDKTLTLPKEKSFPKWERYKSDLNQVRAVDFIINGFIRNGIQVIAGATGVGKSTAIVPIAVGVTGFGLQNSPLQTNRPRKVIYLSEDPEQVERIMYAMKKSGNTRMDDPQFDSWFNLFESKRIPPEEFAKRIDVLANEYRVEQRTPNGVIWNAPLIVADTYSSNFDLENESDNSEVGKCVAFIKEPVMKHQMPVWIVPHTAKALTRGDFDDLSSRGAGAFEGDANGTAFVFKDEKINKVVLRLKKKRYEATINEVVIESESYREVVYDETGDPQEVWCRYGIPTRSTQQDRIEMAETLKENQSLKKEFDLRNKIIEFVNAQYGNEINKESVKSSIKVDRNAVTKMLNLMICEGVLVETKILNKEKVCIKTIVCADTLNAEIEVF